MKKSTKIAIIALTIMGLSALIIIYVPAVYHPEYIIKAESLAEKPATFINLENPDEYVSRAISNPQERVTVPSLEVTQIDELIAEHYMNPNNFQIDGSYYQINMVIVEKFPSSFEYLLFWISFIALPVSATVLFVILVTRISGKFAFKKKT